jgi:hypothetical protein
MNRGVRDTSPFFYYLSGLTINVSPYVLCGEKGNTHLSQNEAQQVLVLGSSPLVMHS